MNFMAVEHVKQGQNLTSQLEKHSKSADLCQMAHFPIYCDLLLGIALVSLSESAVEIVKNPSKHS